MATTQKRGNSYRITASNGYDQNGAQIRPSFTWKIPNGLTEKQIAKELERQKVLFEERVKAGTTYDGNVHFQVFADKWLVEFARKQLKTKTFSEYEKRLPRINQAIGHIKLKDLRTGHLNAFYANLEETGIRADKQFVAMVDILAAIKAQSMTRTAFGAAANISLQTIRAMAAGKRINKVSAAGVCKVLGMKLSEAFKQMNPDQLLSASTVRTYHRIISSCLGKAVKWGYIPYNPAVNAELPKLEQQEAAHLEESQARRLLVLLHAEPIKWRAMITFDLLSGLRRGELLGLRWCDVDFVNETIAIVQTSSYVTGKGVFADTPKNKTSRRPLKLSHSAFLLLLEYKAWQDSQRKASGDQWQDPDATKMLRGGQYEYTDGRVFTNEIGAPIHPDALTKWFSGFVKRSGLPCVHIHSLRHTYASLMIADGIPLVVVSKRLGHAQVSTTANIYAHLIASADEKAAQVTEMFADVIAATPARKKEKRNTTA